MLYEFDGFIFTNEFNQEFPGYKKKGKYVPLHNYIYWLNTGLIPEKGKSAIHHKDGNRKNNEFDNLELLTLSEHGKKHPPKLFKLTIESRRKIRISKQGRGLFGFSGCSYQNREHNPWDKVWRCKVWYNKHSKSLGIFNDPLSCDIVTKLVQEELLIS